MAQDNDKRLAAEAAVAEIADGMRVGIGTGSTVAHLILALGRRWERDFPHCAFFATSKASRHAMLEVGMRVENMAFFDSLDLAIDGADELDRRFLAIKGGGGAMLREKVVASAAARFVVIADGSKQVDALGSAAVPVETLPFARSLVTARLAELGATVSLRGGEDQPFRTDNGNAVLDCRFADLSDPRALAEGIARIPGALGHGLFLDEVDAAYVATDGIVTRLERGHTKG